MPGQLPLSALLSQTLVAFTIELDNEFERQMPHRTTRHGGTPGGPWAVSLAMWSNFMRLVDENGVSVGDLERRARATPHLSGMKRWGYAVVEPDPADTRSTPPQRDWRVRPTDAGCRAQEIWRPLPAGIEDRWRGRFGSQHVGGLRARLEGVVGQFEFGLPEYLTASYGGFTTVPVDGGEPALGALPLSALLSQVLQVFALEFERESKLSLNFSANVVRVLGQSAMRVGDIPRRAGVAIEPILPHYPMPRPGGHPDGS